MLIQHTTNKSLHKLVNVNRLVNRTHQPKRQCISKRQPTCQLNILTNTSMHQSINVNQLVGSRHQLIAGCTSLRRMSIQRNQHVKIRTVNWVRSIRILNLGYCE